MILVTGANGMVGSYIDFGNTIKTDKNTLDVTKQSNIEQFRQMGNITAIVHLAAETDLEWCEKHPTEAFDVNTFGTYNMLKLAMEKDIPFVYISTAGVFDGKKNTAYVEEDKPNPINVYGASKWCGDIIVKTYPKHYIFRASWMMGGGPTVEKKFVGKIIEKIAGGAKVIYGIGDVMGSPTYAKDLAERLHMALKLEIPYGVHNCANEGYASRYDVAKEIVDIMGYDVKVEMTSTDTFKTKDDKHPCPRSHNEMLDMTKINEMGMPMRHWKEALQVYMEEWK